MRDDYARGVVVRSVVLSHCRASSYLSELEGSSSNCIIVHSISILNVLRRALYNSWNCSRGRHDRLSMRKDLWRTWTPYEMLYHVTLRRLLDGITSHFLESTRCWLFWDRATRWTFWEKLNLHRTLHSDYVVIINACRPGSPLSLLGNDSARHTKYFWEMIVRHLHDYSGKRS